MSQGATLRLALYIGLRLAGIKLRLTRAPDRREGVNHSSDEIEKRKNRDRNSIEPGAFIMVCEAQNTIG